MAEELVNFQFPKTTSSIIKVIGVGGGGCNAVNHMHEEGIKGVDYIICNTDSQALDNSPVPVKLQLGTTLTEGRGAGNKPEKGAEAARENYEDLKNVLQNNTKMLFIAAGMGGGTGTGAAIRSCTTASFRRPRLARPQPPAPVCSSPSPSGTASPPWT